MFVRMMVLDDIRAVLRAHGRDEWAAREWRQYGFAADEVDKLLARDPVIEPREAYERAVLRTPGE